MDGKQAPQLSDTAGPTIQVAEPWPYAQAMAHAVRCAAEGNCDDAESM